MFCDLKLGASSIRSITFEDNGKGKVMGLGKVAISRDKTIHNVMHVQSLGYNLMSVSKLNDMDLLVLFSKVDCIVFMSNDYSLVFKGIRKGDLYLVDFSNGPQSSIYLIAKATKGLLWNQ